MRVRSLNTEAQVAWNTRNRRSDLLFPNTNGKMHAYSARKLLIASALSFSGAVMAQAPTAVDLDAYFRTSVTGIQQGNGGTGCMIGVSIAACNENQSTPALENKTYTNFLTSGGAGSGGGAGLGGVFFVNTGSSLTLKNVQFTGNVVRGGEGGSKPDIRLTDATIALVERESDVVALSSFNIQPKLVPESGALKVTEVKLESLSSLLKVGQLVSLEGASGTTTIQAIDTATKTVTLASSVTISPSAIKTLTGDVSTVGSNAEVTGAALTALGQSASFAIGSTVRGTGIDDGTTVKEVVRDGNNVISKIVLSKPVTAPLTAASLEFINAPSLKTSQYTIDTTTDPTGKTLKLSAAALGIAAGMTLSGDGVPADTVVVSVTNGGVNGDTVVLSKALPTTVFGFATKGIIGEVGKDKLLLPTPDSRITVGGLITGTGIPDGTTVKAYDTATGTITLSANLTAVPSEIKTSSIQSQASNTLTLPASTATRQLKAGLILTGDGIPEGTTITSVGAEVNGKITIVLSQNKTSTITGFTASSPLKVGGALNNLQVPAGATLGDNGANGKNGNPVLPALTDGEGLPGFSGQGANKNNNVSSVNAPGGRGGNGGDGSNGIPVNYTLIKETKKSAGEFAEKLGEAAAALSDAPFPGFATAAAAITASIAKGVTLAENIALGVEWIQGMIDGTRARGGDGGQGGSGGDGAEFFGGGPGGSGGAGGAGGLSHIEGGTGGDGGAGGTAGFGAGGGSGGAGGKAGPTGYAIAGGGGDGGNAGFGAGVGSSGDGSGGGGGSAYGGAIFVRGDGSTGGTLTITGNALFRNNYVYAGSSNNGGEAGQSAGSDLFMMRGADVTLSPGPGKTIRFEGSIADDSAASIDGAAWASGNGADIRISGGGLVQFAGTNTYSGKTIIEGGTLEATLGEGIHEDSAIVFKGTGTATPNVTAGTLLLSEDLTKRAGTLPGQVSWDGAGGFSSGTTAGIQINFGRTANSASAGQTLVWGANYLTENSTLVFGSEYSLGPVKWLNDINLDGKTAKIVVFESQQVVDGKKVDGAAYMQGSIYGGGLSIGDVGYTGTLYLTGQNSLNALTIKGGLLMTVDGDGNKGRLFDPSANANLTVESNAAVMLGSEERVGHITVNAGGYLGTLGEKLTATGAVQNSGELVLNGPGNFDSLTNNATGIFVNTGNIKVTKTIANNLNGEIRQGFIGDSITETTIEADSVVNNGEWSVKGEQTLKITGVNGLTGSGVFNLNGLTLDQVANSTFSGVFQGAGSLTKSGAGTLTLTGASTFTGGLTVSAGTIDTTGGGTLADTGAINVSSGATFIAGTADTVGAVMNSGIYSANTAQNVTSLSNAGTVGLMANLTSRGAITNAVGGTVNQSADITAAGTVTNDGTWNVNGARTITTAGLAGAATGSVNVGAALTINQTGNTAYAGAFSGAGGLTKTGTGTLTLQGAANSVNLTGKVVVEQGTLALSGANILAATQDVDVLSSSPTVFGTLALVSGNQSIGKLGGGGVIDTGNGNTLTIEDGGAFTGNVLGKGSVAVKGGSFTVASTLSSTDPNATFNIGTTGTQGATTTIGNGGTLTYATVNLSGGNALNVAAGGTVTTNNLTSAGLVHLGGAGSVINASQSTFTSGGALTGNGALTGSTQMGNGSRIAPGNSPGSLTVGDLSIGAGSTAEIEIATPAAPPRSPGVDYDQVKVTGQLSLLTGSVLDLKQFKNNPGDPDVTIARGETLKIFDVGVGKVSGFFGTVTNNLVNQNVMFNVATGNLVGLGTETYTQFTQRVARTNNQAAMLSALTVNSNGGVNQVYGGALTERLLNAAAGATDAIFAKTSPEVYASLLNQSFDALNDSNSLALEAGRPARAGGTVELFNRNRQTGSSDQYASYKIRGNGIRVGYTGAAGDGLWRVTLSGQEGNVSSDYLTSTTRGNVLSLAGLVPIIGAEGLNLTGRLSYSYFSSDTSRITNAGTASALDIGSNGILGGIGLAYIKEVGGVRWQTSAEIIQSTVSVDQFSERNIASPTDALTVQKQKQDSTDAILGVNARGALSDSVSYIVDASVLTGRKAATPVAATLNTEAIPFQVMGQGLGRTQASLGVGLDFKIDRENSIAVRLNSFGNNGSMASLTYNKLF